MKSLIFSMTRLIMSVVLTTLAWPVLAAEHGSSAPSGPAPMQFIVNVGNSASTMKVLQVTMVLEFASPEATQRIAEIKPKVQHRIIVLLSGEEIASLQTTKGKQELQEKIVKELNGLIDETVETGVSDVFFTSFIMQ